MRGTSQFFFYSILVTLQSDSNFELMNKILSENKSFIKPISDCIEFKTLVFQWASQFDTICYFDNNEYSGYNHHSYEGLIAVGEESSILKLKGDPPFAFEALKNYWDLKKDWLFGFLSYDLKNEVEKLSSNNFDGLSFPEMHFFQPSCVIEIFKNEVRIHSKNTPATKVFEEIIEKHYQFPYEQKTTPFKSLQARISKKEYIQTIESIRQHIIEGDIYEMNFCQEFFAEKTSLDPFETFRRLCSLSKAPFSTFYKRKDQFLMCASPERFLKKEGTRLTSQPIKGTTRRGQNGRDDLLLAEELFNSEKDRAENVMIVDLVRNDLARSCKPGSVKVDELFGIYSFEQVFQMISTVSGELRDDIHFVDAIKNAFPMGSMTGTPKVMSMQLIEHYEKTRRGLYSGAVGYITPAGDFDFNVVIRSILYNTAKQYLSLQVGGAIVFDSVPEEEFEECLLKATAIMEVIENESFETVDSF